MPHKGLQDRFILVCNIPITLRDEGVEMDGEKYGLGGEGKH